MQAQESSSARALECSQYEGVVLRSYISRMRYYVES
jgi:hypothetical protein